MSTKPISLKLPIELLDRLKAKAEATGTNVTALLIEGVSGASAPDPRVAELEAKVASLTTERDQWRDRAKAIVAATPTSNAEGRRLARGRGDPARRSEHPAGPVLDISTEGAIGTVGWCGLKGMDKAAKSGR